jgi:hypothetical protein
MRLLHGNCANIYWAILEKIVISIGHWPVNCAICLECAQCKLKEVVCVSLAVSAERLTTSSQIVSLQDYNNLKVVENSRFLTCPCSISCACLYVAFLVNLSFRSQAFSINGTSSNSNNALFFCIPLFKYFKTQFKGKFIHNLH